MNETFTAREQKDIRQRLEEEAPPSCPRCGSSLLLMPVPPPEDVSYVRRRILVQCPSCRGRAVVDRP